MKNKLSSLFVISFFLLVVFSNVIKGDNNINKKRDMWISRFFLGKRDQKTDNDVSEEEHKAKIEKAKIEKEKKEKEEILTSNNKEDMNDVRSMLLLKEIYEKDNQLSIISRKKKKYKTATFTLGTLLTLIAVRALANLAVNGLTKLVQKEENALTGLLFDKWNFKNFKNFKKNNVLIETLV
ncbi:conserved Plasmodium protein, unknown function [Plasmodium ovale]|uniref:CRA domain-containing protein n=2 Tax=Plasmodium ovale TaxID=36330 RepID=A0A1A8WRG8_PLAOA|nr:conserved Plasmodium protein, unknown function [Plasmodium ovale curtisi]SBT83464.1 conserved Plasmodium protein, unknown function [Plasmodium ovale]